MTEAAKSPGHGGWASPFAEAGMQCIVLDHSVDLGTLEAVDGSRVAAVQEGAARRRQLRLKDLHKNAAWRTAAVVALAIECLQAYRFRV